LTRVRVPVIQGVIDRRILVNYRVDPEAIAAVLPAPFAPKLAGGCAIGGVCLIRLMHVRPKHLPIPIGIRSENAAHRIAVEWREGGALREGVYIPRRDTDSRLNVLAGGRFFPGQHHHATFEVEESDERLSVALTSDDGAVRVAVRGRPAEELPEGSVFGSLAEASSFFERGAIGYSATDERGRYDGLELRCRTWSVTPLDVEEARSSFFEDARAFPPGTVAFDCALLMRHVEHEWHGRDDLCCAVSD
jgi:hypothetical protein